MTLLWPLLFIAVQTVEEPIDDDTIVEEGSTTETAPEPAGGETLVARRRDLKRVVGSAYTVDKETLERFKPDDVNRALRAVPGVYVRDEDGQGLRPNIGLRGASSDRSAKVVLLEDGVLFAPAPYSAPAAYYFPLTTRMVGIEVFKGPAAIRQGPHTVGGAVNLRTRPVPFQSVGSLNVGFGLVGAGREQSRLHGVAGVGDETWGVLIEGARVQSDGFKHIDGAPDAPTGFLRDDVMLKARVASGFLEELRHTLELKLGYGREESDETYLGLSDEDFRQDPLRRYAASASDHMSWGRTQAQLRYSIAVREDLEVDVVGYRHDLARSWNKVNGVRGAPNLHDVLTFADAGAFPIFAGQLSNGDVEGTDPGGVLIGPNQRTFVSQGIALTARAKLTLGPPRWAVEQRLELGVRLHNDGVDRLHSERAFNVVRGAVIDAGEDDVVTADNQAGALALAAHVADEIRFLDLVLVPGMRVELIHGTFTDKAAGAALPGKAIESDQLALMPGLGLAWQPAPVVVVVAGVHRGFSPIAPGQSADVRPEESTNGEAGVRLDLREALGLSAEVIGFYSQYENILGECTYSAGCGDDIGVQQNGGAAGIGGAEFLVRHELPLRLGAAWGESRLKLEATYTFTRAVFLTTFDSSHPLFSKVNAGDEMAYVPAHQAAFTGALVLDDLDVGASIGLVSAMRDVPGQGETLAHERTDTQAVVDVATSYQLLPGVRIALRADNLLDQQAIVSRRPFGARPGKPRSFMVSLELDAL
ncbi:MAG: TonB-dependent receptor [Deltaproteobacteria bacterium]|nr:TonB-dependent receptor [Deltaproteobacteria bacterium]